MADAAVRSHKPSTSKRTPAGGAPTAPHTPEEASEARIDVEAVTNLLLGTWGETRREAREMIKDIEDIPGDRQHQVRTLAVLFGPHCMAVTAALLFVGATALLFDPSLITSFSTSYLWLNLLVVTPMSLILAVRVGRSRGASAAWARGWSKAIFGMMLVAVLCGMVRLN